MATGTMTPVTGGGVSLSGEGPGLPPTLLPPQRYAAIMNINISHFQQLAGVKAPLVAGCDDIWDQGDREMLVWAMQQAEELIANELRFWPVPAFVTDEEIPFGLRGVRPDWQNAEATTKWGRVIAYGTEKLTLIQAGAVVQYSDDDDDPLGREEKATIGTALYADLTACANECEVVVFFRVADGAVDAADPMFEIRPLRVDIDGSTMHITGESSLFINPTLWTLRRQECAGTDEPNAWRWDWDVSRLVAQVDVYCRTVDTQTPVTVKWDGVCTCTSPCSHYTQLACAYVTDWKHGFFAPRLATWNGTTHIDAYADYTGVPESLVVNYRSGYPLGPHCRMDSLLERAIVKLTNVLLTAPPCGYCDIAERLWKADRADIDPLTPEAASMPWAMYQQGALEAWRIIKRLKMGQGGKLGR